MDFGESSQGHEDGDSDSIRAESNRNTVPDVTNPSIVVKPFQLIFSDGEPFIAGVGNHQRGETRMGRTNLRLIVILFTSILFLTSIAPMSLADRGRAISVVITDPEEMEPVSDIVNITGTSTDVDPIWDKISIDVDGLREGDARQVVAGSWNLWYFNWNTNSYLDGDVMIEAVTIGLVATDSVNVTISNTATNERPTVQINSHAEGNTVRDTVNIAGSAADADGDVERVEISIDLGSWQTTQGTESWEFEWDSTTLSDGTVSIRVRSVDDDQDVSDIDEIQLTVENDEPSSNAVPEITITSPLDGFPVSSFISIQGSASDSDGNVQLIQISIEGGAWLPALGTDSWSYYWLTTAHADGPATIRARATDNDQALSQIAYLNVSVTNEDISNSSNTTYSVQLLAPTGGEHWMGVAHTVVWTHDMPSQCVPWSDVYHRNVNDVNWSIVQFAVLGDRIEWFHTEGVGSINEHVIKVVVNSLTCRSTNVTSEPFTVAIPLLTIPQWPEKPDGAIVLVLDPAAPNETLMPHPAPLDVYNESFWDNLDEDHEQFSIIRIPPYWPLELAIEEYQPATIVLSSLGLSIWDLNRSIWGAGGPADIVQDVRNDIALFEYLENGGGLIVTHDTLSDWGIPGLDYLASSGGHIGLSDDYDVKAEMNLAVELGLGWIPIFEQMKMTVAQGSGDYQTFIQNAPLLPSFVPFSGDWNVQSPEHPLTAGIAPSSHIEVNCPVRHDTDHLYCDENGLRPYTMIGWQMAYPDVAIGMWADSLQESELAMSEWGRMAGMDVSKLSGSLNATATLLYSIQATLSEMRDELPWVNITIPAWSIVLEGETIQFNETNMSFRIPDDIYQRLGPAEIVALSDDKLAAVLAWEGETHRAVTFTWKPESTDNNDTRRWMANAISWTGSINLTVPDEQDEAQGASTLDDQSDEDTEDSISLAGTEYSIQSLKVIGASVGGVLILLVMIIIVSGRRERKTDDRYPEPLAARLPLPSTPMPEMPAPIIVPHTVPVTELISSPPPEPFIHQTPVALTRVFDHTGLPGGGSYTTEGSIVKYHDPFGRVWVQLPDGGFEMQSES